MVFLGQLRTILQLAIHKLFIYCLVSLELANCYDLFVFSRFKPIRRIGRGGRVD